MSTDIFKENNITLPSIEEADNIDNPPIIAKFTNEKWDWYVVGGDKLKNNDYLLFICKYISNQYPLFYRWLPNIKLSINH